MDDLEQTIKRVLRSSLDRATNDDIEWLLLKMLWRIEELEATVASKEIGND
jgi:hypothetical protein